MSRELTNRNNLILKRVKDRIPEKDIMREFHFKSRKSIYVIVKRNEKRHKSKDGNR